MEGGGLRGEGVAPFLYIFFLKKKVFTALGSQH